MTTNNKPASEIRDRDIKITFWKNIGEKGTFYSGDPGRTFTDEHGTAKTARSFSGTEWLRLSQLALKAYEHEQELKKQDAEAEKMEPLYQAQIAEMEKTGQTG